VKSGEISQSGILRQTVSLKAQTVLTKLVDAVSIYNIDVTNNIIQNDIVECIGDKYYSVLERYNAPVPCTIDFFVDASCRYIDDPKSQAILRYHLDRDRLLEAYAQNQIEHTAEYEITLEDGKVHTMRHKIILTHDDAGDGIIARCSTRDVTQMVEVSKNLNVAEDKIVLGMAVVESLVQDCNVIWLLDPERRTLELFRTLGNKFVQSTVNMGNQLQKYDDVLRKYVDDYVIDEDKERVLREAAMDEMVAGADRDGLRAVNYQRIDNEGKPSYRQVICAKSDITGGASTYVLAFRDIDEQMRKEMEIAQKQAEQIEFIKALAQDYLTVYRVNVEERTAEVIKLDGYKTKGVKGSGMVFAYDALVRQYIRERVYPEDQKALSEKMSLEKVVAALKNKKSYSSGYRYINNGEIYYCQFVFIKMPKTNYIVAGFKNVDDVVDAAKERESLLIMSETDMMTGLLNRGSGENKSTMLLEKNKAGMLCILDIDKFKSINDTYGHAIGDKVIISVAQCLKDAFRERDIVFRLGGDEFAVYAVGDIAEENARKIFDRFFNKISKLEIPEIGDRKITTSVGAVLVSEDNKRSFEELYKAADGCVYESKKSEGNVLNIC